MFQSLYASYAGAKAMRLAKDHLQTTREPDLTLVISYLREAVKYKCRGAWQELGKAYKRNGQIEEAAVSFFRGSMTEHLCLFELQNIAEGSQPPAVALTYMGILSERNYLWKNAEKYYKQAIEKNDPEAMYRMGLLLQNNPDKKAHQREIPPDQAKALEYFGCAAKFYHARALDVLLQRSGTDAKAALALAKLYEDKTWAPHNPDKVIHYLQKAAKFNDPQANLQLAQKSTQQKPGEKQNPLQTLHYYLEAAKNGAAGGLESACYFAKEQKNPEVYFILAEHYHKTLKDIPAALPWYFMAAYKQHQQANQQLTQLAQQSSTHGLLIAHAYYHGTYGEKQLQQAYHYYMQAALKGEQQALQWLQQYAEKDANAQYALGVDYFHVAKQFDKAVDYCLRAAAQQHVGAKCYIEQTDFPAETFLRLAKMYEKGDKYVEADDRQALIFYQKSWRKSQNPELAYYLGQHALYSSTQPRQFNQTAWDYFLSAANNGYKLALLSLQRLALTGSLTHKKQLTQCQASYKPQIQSLNLSSTAPVPATQKLTNTRR